MIVVAALTLSITHHLHGPIRATRFTQPHCTPPITTHHVLVSCSTIVAAPCCLHHTTPTSMLHLISQTYCLQRFAEPLVPTHPVFLHCITLHPPSGALIITTQCAHKHSTQETHKKAKQRAAQQMCHSMQQHSSQQAMVNDPHHHTAPGRVHQC